MFLRDDMIRLVREVRVFLVDQAVLTSAARAWTRLRRAVGTRWLMAAVPCRPEFAP